MRNTKPAPERASLNVFTVNVKHYNYKSDLKRTELCQCNSCENSDILADELIELEAQFLENEFELEESDVDDDDDDY